MHGQRIGFFSNIMKLWYWWILKYTKSLDSCLEGECIEPNFMKLKIYIFSLNLISKLVKEQIKSFKLENLTVIT